MTYWFVGASYDNRDQTDRFLNEGIWENGYTDRYIDIVNSMLPGEHIAIKATYTQRHNLPFDNREQTVSVMAIKAIGIIEKNFKNGRNVKVKWSKLEPKKIWYFKTNQLTIHGVESGNWEDEALIDFAFRNGEQDITRFRNHDSWATRFGDRAEDSSQFGWTKFYEAIATKLLDHKNDRTKLIAGIRDIANRTNGLDYLHQDRYEDGTTGFLNDICPFTTMGMFNRGVTEENRRAIAAELAKFLGVTEQVPDTFEGIPVLNNLSSWYFGYKKVRPDDHISALWEVFSCGLDYVETADTKVLDKFSKAFDEAMGRPNVAWNLTFGLYWARPWTFLSLDSNSRTYITQTLGIEIGHNGPNQRCNAMNYLAAMDTLKSKFKDSAFCVHSFPAISYEAWQNPGTKTLPIDSNREDTNDQHNGSPTPQVSAFNRIYYGPPGTGKTFKLLDLLKRDYGADEANDQRYSFVTFHQSYGYEEFVEGLRPVLDTGEVKYEIHPGAFKKLCEKARNAPLKRFAMVIDEINRGNISKIFGELITLIEPDKREGKKAVPVTLPYSGESFSIPPNIDIIGTMNTADRSLALLDTALRRRFDFEPLLPDTRDKKTGEDTNSAPLAGLFVDANGSAIDIRLMLERINERIEVLYDRDHCIGHAYFTELWEVSDGANRFEKLTNIFSKRIVPLLEEYFFEDWHKIRLVLGDNQKRATAQFITEGDAHEQDLSALFGNSHGLDNYSTKRRYQLQPSAFGNPDAYIGIYQALR